MPRYCAANRSRCGISIRSYPKSYRGSSARLWKKYRAETDMRPAKRFDGGFAPAEARAAGFFGDCHEDKSGSCGLRGGIRWKLVWIAATVGVALLSISGHCVGVRTKAGPGTRFGPSWPRSKSLFPTTIRTRPIVTDGSRLYFQSDGRTVEMSVKGGTDGSHSCVLFPGWQFSTFLQTDRNCWPGRGISMMSPTGVRFGRCRFWGALRGSWEIKWLAAPLGRRMAARLFTLI